VSDWLGLVVVPTLALLLYRFLPFPDESEDEVDDAQSGKASEPLARLRAEPAQRMTEPRSVAPITVAAVLPLLALGFIAIALVSTLSSRQH
jgi:hypothetical protein